ncbi:MAG: ABA4-like family protein [Thermaurantiacus sp.]
MANADLVFSIANWIVLVGWAALLLAPLRREGAILLARIAAALVAGIYVTLVIRGVAMGPGLPEGAGFSSLAGVEALLSTRAAILGGWVHFLTFDLFVASWIVEDAPRAGVPHWLLVPAILLTLFAGPAGLLLYLLIAGGFRLAARR